MKNHAVSMSELKLYAEIVPSRNRRCSLRHAARLHGRGASRVKLRYEGIALLKSKGIFANSRKNLDVITKNKIDNWRKKKTLLNFIVDTTFYIIYCTFFIYFK